MGQYYQALLLNSRGVVRFDPQEFTMYSKLTEHAWIGNSFVNAVYLEILDTPQRVAWIGDYADDAYVLGIETFSKGVSQNDYMRYYELAWSENYRAQAVSGKAYNYVMLEGLLTLDTRGTYLINHNKKVYIDMGRYIQGSTVDGWCLNPLPLLTACGNGQGGGDFYEGNTGYENVGIWAFDTLEYASAVPEDRYQEVLFRFIEDASSHSCASIPIDKLAGRTFVVTGKMDGYKRDEFTRLIKDNGGSVGASVTTRTDYLVVGEKPGSKKMSDALRHGTRTITQQQLLDMIA